MERVCRMRLGAAKLAWPERDLVSQAERAMGVDHRHSDVDRQCEHFVALDLNTSHEGRSAHAPSRSRDTTFDGKADAEPVATARK